MNAELSQYFAVEPGLVRVYSTRFGLIDFRIITEKQALQLVESGSTYIRLTAAGRDKYLGESPEPQMEQESKIPTTAKEISAAIRKVETEEQAKALMEIKPESKTVQDAYNKRLAELNSA